MARAPYVKVTPEQADEWSRRVAAGETVEDIGRSIGKSGWDSHKVRYHTDPEYRAEVISRHQRSYSPLGIVDAYLSRSRTDGTGDIGPVGGPRRATTTTGRHRTEIARATVGPADEFATTADALDKVLKDIGKQQLRRYRGRDFGAVVTVLASDPVLVQFGESVGVEVRLP